MPDNEPVMKVMVIICWSLVNLHLTIFGIPGREVVKVVSIVEPHLEQGML